MALRQETVFTVHMPPFCRYLVFGLVSTDPLQRAAWKVNWCVVTWWYSNENGFPPKSLIFLFNVLFAWVTAFVEWSVFCRMVCRTFLFLLERWILCVRNLDTHKYEIFCRETKIPFKYLSWCKFFSGEFSFWRGIQVRAPRVSPAESGVITSNMWLVWTAAGGAEDGHPSSAGCADGGTGRLVADPPAPPCHNNLYSRVEKLEMPICTGEEENIIFRSGGKEREGIASLCVNKRWRLILLAGFCLPVRIQWFSILDQCGART